MNLIRLDYWFNIRPLFFRPMTFKIFMIVSLLVIVAGIILSILQSRQAKNKLQKKTIGNFSTWFYTFGIINLIYIFLRQQRAPYLSLRFLYLLWFIASVIWLGFLFKFMLIDAPKKVKEQQQKAEFEKYLP